MVYIRKIEEFRWRAPHFYDSDTISDLHTDQHDLSVWSYREGDEEEKKKALLALIMSRCEFKDFFYIELTDKEIGFLKFDINDKEGDTQFKKYKYLHKNIEVKTVLGLTSLAWIIKKKVVREEAVLMEVDDIKELVKQFATPSEMSFDDLLYKGFKQIYKECNNIK